MKNTYYYILLIGLLALLTSSCKEEPVLLFSVQDDLALGLQVKEQIEADPATYPILSETDYSEAYAYLRTMFNTILNNGTVRYRDEFAWELYIIEDDETLNAFATPGGYIYVYTGLIKYLDQEDDLAGVLGHEIAHSDLRHTSRNLQRVYGIQVLLSLIVGQNPNQLTQIAAQIAGGAAGLSFSRAFEEEADAKSVEYLANTPYACNGAYYFFQKLLDANQAGRVPTFLSTHPAPQDRVNAINAKAEAEGCDTTPLNPPSYEDFKNMLP
jgi:beta-barrel assembly-enhancing protease